MTESTTENLKAEAPLAQEKIEHKEQLQKVEVKTDQKASDKTEDTKEDPNWRAFREARKKDRAEKEAAERKAADKEAEVAALKAAMEAAFSKQSPVQQSNQYVQQYAQEETEDERIEKKVQAAISAREASYEKERAQREKHEAPLRIQQTFPDFNNVVTQDNCDYIDYHYPELATPFQYMPEGYQKLAAMYNLIKKMVPNSTSSKREAAKADANFNKPKSMSTTGVTQSGDSQGSARLTEERKAANWERMERARRGLSS